LKDRKLLKTLIASILIIFLLVNSRAISNTARIAFSDFVTPFLEAVQSGLSVILKFMPFASLKEENRLLRARIDLLTRRTEEMQSLYAENERLKAIIGFKKSVPYTTIGSKVIGRDPTNWSNSLIIDKGSADGVRQNRAVVSTKGLVGRTIEVGRVSSKVLLITDPNSKVGVMIQKNNQGGMLTGGPDGTCKMVYIPLDSDVAPGDRIVTAGFGSIFPKGILVGKVVSVDKEPGRLYKTAIVKTAAEISRLEEVLCIR
jgi:rod shape-determining protein MreC